MSVFDEMIDKAWDEIVGKADDTYHWLKGLLLGQFSPEDQSLAVMAADMIAGCVIPGCIIVTSIRDGAAIIVRMGRDPDKQSDVLEWIMLCGCFVTLALPIVAAAAGLAADGVGALITGYLGEEAAAFLRALILLLIEDVSKSAGRILGTLNKIVKGNLLKILKMVRFSQLEQPLIKKLIAATEQLIAVTQTLRKKLLDAHIFGYKFAEHLDTAKKIISTLEAWEKRFYNVQRLGTTMIPKAITELQSRIDKLVEEMLPKEAHEAQTGTTAAKPIASVAEKPAAQHVYDPAGKQYREYDAKVEAEKKAATAHASNQNSASANSGHANSSTNTGSANSSTSSAAGGGGSSGGAGGGKPPPEKPPIKEKPDVAKQHVDGEHPNTKGESGGKDEQTIAKILKYREDLDARVRAEAAVRIANKTKGQAISKVGINSGKESNFFENIILDDLPEKFPGLKLGKDDLIRVADEEKFMTAIEKQYKDAGNPLHPRIKELISKYLKHIEHHPIHPGAGVPGLHAEVLAANDFLNKFGEVEERIIVPTYKTGKASGSGKKGEGFMACSNCSGILNDIMFDVIHGRFKPR